MVSPSQILRTCACMAMMSGWRPIERKESGIMTRAKTFSLQKNESLMREAKNPSTTSLRSSMLARRERRRMDVGVGRIDGSFVRGSNVKFDGMQHVQAAALWASLKTSKRSSSRGIRTENAPLGMRPKTPRVEPSEPLPGARTGPSLAVMGEGWNPGTQIRWPELVMNTASSARPFSNSYKNMATDSPSTIENRSWRSSECREDEGLGR